MNCPHCTGIHLVRNGMTRAYKTKPDTIGLRYLCRDCGRTHLIQVKEQEDNKFLRRAIPSGPDGGRPTRMDWRFA